MLLVALLATLRFVNPFLPWGLGILSFGLLVTDAPRRRAAIAGMGMLILLIVGAIASSMLVIRTPGGHLHIGQASSWDSFFGALGVFGTFIAAATYLAVATQAARRKASRIALGLQAVATMSFFLVILNERTGLWSWSPPDAVHIAAFLGAAIIVIVVLVLELQSPRGPPVRT